MTKFILNFLSVFLILFNDFSFALLIVRFAIIIYTYIHIVEVVNYIHLKRSQFIKQLFRNKDEIFIKRCLKQMLYVCRKRCRPFSGTKSFHEANKKNLIYPPHEFVAYFRYIFIIVDVGVVVAIFIRLKYFFIIFYRSFYMKLYTLTNFFYHTRRGRKNSRTCRHI